jgi:truncated hemoglobin YjbI
MPEWWGSPLIQEEKYQEKPVKREEINNSIKFFILRC